MSASSNPRRGLHRLECGCGGYVYATVSALERFGLPSCPCGERFEPERVDVAMILGLEDCAAVLEFRREASSVMHGQAPRAIRYGGAVRDPELVAAERVEKRRRERARSNRLGALRPAAEPMPF